MKWWVNAPGAKSVSYESKKSAANAAKQVRGGRVSKGSPKAQPRHAHSDEYSGGHKSWWQRLIG